MKIMLVGSFYTTEHNFMKAVLSELGENAQIVSMETDEFLDNQTVTVNGEPVVMTPVEVDQLIFTESVAIEPKKIPITYGPIKKRGKGKIQRW